MVVPTFFTCESAVRGYHIYQGIWGASCGQTFPCLQEEGNPFNLLAVSVVRAGSNIRHVPNKISHCSCEIVALLSQVGDDIQEIFT